MDDKKTTDGRRSFLKAATFSSSSLALSAKAYSQVLGANEKVNIGLIGYGLIGRVHVKAFSELKQARIVAVSDTYKPRMQACQEHIQDVQLFADFRDLLDRPEVDAVVVATPDHWHALHTMMACAAGKDVLVEKPTHLFVREGEWMQQVAKKHNRVVQIGTQQRSGPHYQRAKELLRNGAIGEIVSVQCDFFRNVMPGIGTPPDTEPPHDLDWEMHRGPAPMRPYNVNRGLYHFRWYWETSGGQMTNLGHHSLDIVHWIFDIQYPKSVCSHGGRWFLQDNGETPDVQNAIIEYEKFPAILQIREACAGGSRSTSGSLLFMGTKGIMTLSRSGFEIVPDTLISPVNSFAGKIGVHPVGGPQPVKDPLNRRRCEPMLDRSGSQEKQYVLHAQNFVDCIKSRGQPHSDLASSHWVSSTCHLANISLRTGRKVIWDANANGIHNDIEANNMLERSYRAPWDKVLRSLIS